MFRSLLLVLAITAFSFTASAHQYRYEKAYSDGFPKRTRSGAENSAISSSHAECKRTGGSVRWGTNGIVDCWYVGRDTQCKAVCGCKFRVR